MKRLAAVAAFLFTFGVHAEDWGKFSEPLHVELLGEKNLVMLLADFTYQEPGPKGYLWHAPKGTISDAASIPQVAWSVIGAPLEGQYRKAAIIHDVGCKTRIRDWKSTHRAFYTGMRSAGVNELQAKIMYAAVYHFGPRWVKPKNIPGIVIPPSDPNDPFSKAPGAEAVLVVQPVVSQAKFEQMKGEIEMNNLSLSEIEKF